MNSVYSVIKKRADAGKPQLAVLVDPDKFNPDIIPLAEQCRVSFFLVGGSLITNGDFEKTISLLKKRSSLPVIIFPGDEKQVSSKADALLFLSLISGRNPEYLIGMQVRSAALIKRKKLESISTGYILVESGSISTTQKVSGTRPIPASDFRLAADTAIAGEMMGQQLIYLEAGSGAKKNVPLKLIRSVKKNISVPLVVGGGISSSRQAKQILEAGADIIVVGNALEKDMSLLYDMKKLF
ncbi:MAG: geranylgeranylglyceryl/heptaprenylglyceryl phosphate synthase [Bacteroidia bacterium]